MADKIKISASAKEEAFWELQRTLSAEFGKYVLVNPKVEDEIPDGAQVVFELEKNPDFNKWAQEIARSQMEPDQPLVVVKAKGLLPPTASRLINPRLELVPTHR